MPGLSRYTKIVLCYSLMIIRFFYYANIIVCLRSIAGIWKVEDLFCVKVCCNKKGVIVNMGGWFHGKSNF